ncbi:hypothetical protein TNCV_4467061 [Trichonephila clavipes]|nr:hypothetical protein TNCV_4467061 [Trichonephila clavipes]
MVYARINQKRSTILEDNIRRVFADMRPRMLEKSSKIGRQIGLHPSQPWRVICQKSYLKWIQKRILHEKNAVNHNAVDKVSRGKDQGRSKKKKLDKGKVIY